MTGDALEATVETYESVAEEYERRHRSREAVADLVERFDGAVDDPDDDPAQVLDVGCGPGWETATFAGRGYDVLGVDPTPAFVRRTADRTPTADVARMDMRDPAVAPGCVDGVWACASFLHVPREDAGETLVEFERVLRDGGALLLVVKRGEGTTTGNSYDGDDRTFTLYRPDALRERVREAGLAVEWTEADDDWVALLARA